MEYFRKRIARPLARMRQLLTFIATMTIEISYDKKQVLDGLRSHFFSRPEIRILFILVNLFAIASAILFYFKIIHPLSFLVFSLLWFLLWFAVRKFLPMSIYRRSQTFRDQFVMKLEDQGVVLETNRGRQMWQWTDFSSFKETVYFFHLYFDPRSFFLVPKDSFKDITEIQSARELLRARIKK